MRKIDPNGNISAAVQVVLFLIGMPALAWFLGIWVTSQFLAGVLVMLCAVGISWALYRWKSLWEVDGVWLGIVPIWIILSALLFFISFWRHYDV